MQNFNEGNDYYNNKEYEKAIESYKISIDNKENEACSYYNAGVCFIKLKRYDEAIVMLKKALKLQKESKYFFNLAYCYAIKGETNKSLVYFNLSWALDSTDLDCEKAINLIISKNKKAL